MMLNRYKTITPEPPPDSYINSLLNASRLMDYVEVLVDMFRVSQRQAIFQWQPHVLILSDGSASNRYFDDIIPMGECEVRDALMNEVKRHRYWKSSAFKKMQFERLEMLNCLHYVLESFTEARATSEATEAVTPGALLDQGSSSIQNPWDFEVLPSNMFSDQVRVLEMPGSSTINACSVCNSEGTYHCFHCRGLGTDKCNFCRGTGMKAGVAHPAVYTHPMVATFPHVSIYYHYVIGLRLVGSMLR
ncbi:unnamed protein product [Strongylus vulgaris]|uniref:Uncharacterized protein n=1 Tax=Strongylus vulgaris TaxID=40348 RepID=A0A3P7J2K3_STRVU|nr:unnamed protein product [Strongylus vulgaris]